MFACSNVGQQTRALFGPSLNRKAAICVPVCRMLGVFLVLEQAETDTTHYNILFRIDNSL